MKPLRAASSSSQASCDTPSIPARFRGVRKRSWGSWVSEIRIPHSRKRIWLGSYHNAVQAAKAYDVAAACLRGSSATLNFPHSPPLLPTSFSMSPTSIQKLAALGAAQNLAQPDPMPAAHDSRQSYPDPSKETSSCLPLQISELPRKPSQPLALLPDLSHDLVSTDHTAIFPSRQNLESPCSHPPESPPWDAFIDTMPAMDIIDVDVTSGLFDNFVWDIY